MRFSHVRDFTHLRFLAIFGDFRQLRLSRERRQILKIGPHYDVPSGQISLGTNFCVNRKSHREEKRIRTYIQTDRHAQSLFIYIDKKEMKPYLYRMLPKKLKIIEMRQEDSIILFYI